MRYYSYLVRPVKANFDTNYTDEDVRIVGEHFRYLVGLHEKGIVQFAGRCDDTTFGIVILRADNRAEAEKLFANDPAIVQGVMSGSLHEFRIALCGNFPSE
ncbi:MAG: YciI family protein [bacterium]|nr:YciI family protein [bacterium]